MNSRFFTLLLCIAVICFGISSKAQNEPNKQNSLLWKVSKKEIKEASYLFGTMHIICPDDYVWTDVMQQSLSQCQQLCLEVDLSDPNLMSEAAMLMMDLSGGTIRDYFTNENDYNAVVNYIQDSLKQNMQMLERMKPAALIMLFSTGAVNGQCAEPISYEFRLMEKIKDKNYTIQGLETLAEQMEFFESIPSDTLIAEILRIAKGESNDNQELNLLVSAYKKQDLSSIQKIMQKASESGALDNKKMIDQRNSNWIKPMSEMMQQKPSFFAVGAGHLSGLIKLLQIEGYTVSPVR